MAENNAVLPGETGPPTRRIPAVAEAFGYVGGALALAALVTLMSMFWGELGVWGRTGICAAVAAAGLVGGLVLDRLEEPAARRLAHFLLFLGVAAVGCAAGFVTQHVALQQLAGPMSVASAGQKADEWAWFIGMLAVAVSGGLVWMNHKTWLQHLAFGVGVGMSSLLVLPLLPIEGPDWGAGLVLAVVGLLWGALALRGWLPPENAALLLSSAGILGGIQLMAMNGSGGEAGLLAWAVWLGFAASIGLVVAGAGLKRLVVVGAGAVGLVLFGVELITEVFEFGMGTPIAFLAVGFALVVGATYMTRRPLSADRPALHVVAEIAGYAGAAFVFVGTGTLLGEHWDELSTATRILVPAAVSGVAYACGFIADRAEGESAHRLSQVLLGGGVVAAAATVGMIVYSIALDRFGPNPETPGATWVAWRDAGSWAFFAAALGAIAIGGLTWWRKRGAITELVTAAACFMAVTAGFQLIPQEQIGFWWPGAVLMAIGVAWVVMGVLERFRPSNMAIGAGSVLTIIGITMLQNDPSGDPHKWSALLGITVSVLAIIASLALKRAVLLGFGAAGMVLFSFMTVQLYFEGRIAGPIALLVTGVVFIVMAVLVAAVLPRFRGRSRGDGLRTA